MFVYIHIYGQTSEPLQKTVISPNESATIKRLSKGSRANTMDNFSFLNKYITIEPATAITTAGGYDRTEMNSIIVNVELSEPGASKSITDIPHEVKEGRKDTAHNTFTIIRKISDFYFS